MSIETLKKVNGMCFGEIESAQEIEIPAFVNEDYQKHKDRQWREHNEQAQIAAAAGAGKRKARQARRAERRRMRQNIRFLIAATFIALLFFSIGAIVGGFF